MKLLTPKLVEMEDATALRDPTMAWSVLFTFDPGHFCCDFLSDDGDDAADTLTSPHPQLT